MNVKINMWWSENIKRWRWTLVYDVGAAREMNSGSHEHLTDATAAIYNIVNELHEKNTSIIL